MPIVFQIHFVPHPPLFPLTHNSQYESPCIDYWTEALQCTFKDYVSEIFAHVSTLLPEHTPLSFSNFRSKVHNNTEFLG